MRLESLPSGKSIALFVFAREPFEFLKPVFLIVRVLAGNGKARREAAVNDMDPRVSDLSSGYLGVPSCKVS